MLAVLVLVALGAYAYLYWWSQTPVHGVLDDIPVVRDASDSASRAVVRTPGTTPDGAEGTDTDSPRYTYRSYENSEFGFSFSYPDAWTASAKKISPETRICLTEADSTGDCLVTVAFEKESVNLNAGIALDALRADGRAGRIAESSSRVAGQDATVLKVSNYPAGEEAYTRAAVFTHQDMVYTIQAEKGQEAVFDRIIASFAVRD